MKMKQNEVQKVHLPLHKRTPKQTFQVTFTEKRLRELTFLHHSLQNIHVVLLRHAAERGELGLGDKLQELEERKRL